MIPAPSRKAERAVRGRRFPSRRRHLRPCEPQARLRERGHRRPRQLQQVDGVRARLRHARGEEPARPEQKYEAARGRHGEDAERELGHVPSRVPAQRVHERRAERRRIERVGDADRDDEYDERQHRPSLTDAVRTLAAVPPRVLILTASVGEGHDLPARTLADAAARGAARRRGRDRGLPRRDGARRSRSLSEGAARVVFYRFLWLWDVGFWVFAGSAPTRASSRSGCSRASALRGCCG